MRWMIVLLIGMMMVSCTDWKSKYWQAQLELERLRQQPPQTEVVVDTLVVPDYPPVYDQMPIVVPDVQADTTKPPVTPPTAAAPVRIERIRREVIRKDSVTVWLTLQTRLLGTVVHSRVTVDSIRYPRVVRTIIRVQRIPVEQPMRKYPWEDILLGLAGLVTLVLILRIVKNVFS